MATTTTAKFNVYGSRQSYVCANLTFSFSMSATARRLAVCNLPNTLAEVWRVCVRAMPANRVGYVCLETKFSIFFDCGEYGIYRDAICVHKSRLQCMHEHIIRKQWERYESATVCVRVDDEKFDNCYAMPIDQTEPNRVSCLPKTEKRKIWI